MSSETAICNMALLQLGADRITSLDDDSREAKLCLAFYATVRDAVLESGAWTFATDRAILVPDATPPSWGYANRFLLPTECLLVREVHDTSQDPAPTIDDWEVENGYLLIDVATVWIRYTLRITDTSKFSKQFVMALAAMLASELSIPLTNSRSLEQQKAQKAERYTQDALNIDGSQGQNQKVRSAKRLTNARGRSYGRGVIQ